jgi:hypothetical protein
MTHEFTETEKQEALRDAVAALGKHLGIDPQALWVLAEPQEHEHHGLAVYEIEGQEYALGTDQDADAAARDYIDESLWAFNAEFILSCCGLDLSGAESLRHMQEKAYEGAQDFIASLIKKTCGLDYFVERATNEDGRGHFLARYDGEEIELPNNFYAYRI